MTVLSVTVVGGVFGTVTVTVTWRNVALVFATATTARAPKGWAVPHAVVSAEEKVKPSPEPASM
jgi:hypothetical protein